MVIPKIFLIIVYAKKRLIQRILSDNTSLIKALVMDFLS